MIRKEGLSFDDEPLLSTALYYGLYTDTNRLSEISHPLDRDMIEELTVQKSIITKMNNSNISMDELFITGRAILKNEYDPIGVEGEIYPIKKEKFEKSYVLKGSDYEKTFEYSPRIKNLQTEEKRQVLPFAKKALSTTVTAIYARPLTKSVKLFTAWDRERYYSGEPGDSGVILLTSSCRIILYKPREDLLEDYTYTWFSDPPKEYGLAAAIKEDRLYIWFSDADYMAVYEWVGNGGHERIGSINFNERKETLGRRLEDGDEVKSDDGKYIMSTGPNHTLLISDAKSRETVKTLYDMSGGYNALKELPGIGGYMLVSDGKYSFQLDPDLNIIAAIPYFYEYDREGKAFLLYRYTKEDEDYELYRVPVASYEDLISEADKLLSGYCPSKEVLDKYKMMQ
ncbi:MAG: hypothetical protein K5989_10375 [Lachnospiraceae bacterium]|nr:hypothetical protein [Lachnospiraceae bacterium]